MFWFHGKVRVLHFSMESCEWTEAANMRIKRRDFALIDFREKNLGIWRCFKRNNHGSHRDVRFI